MYILILICIYIMDIYLYTFFANVSRPMHCLVSLIARLRSSDLGQLICSPPFCHPGRLRSTSKKACPFLTRSLTTHARSASESCMTLCTQNPRISGSIVCIYMCIYLYVFIDVYVHLCLAKQDQYHQQDDVLNKARIAVGFRFCTDGSSTSGFGVAKCIQRCLIVVHLDRLKGLGNSRGPATPGA